MIVIEHGNQYKTVKCPTCSAKIGYLKREIKEWEHGEYIGYWTLDRYLTCPECNEKIILRRVENGKVTISNGRRV